MRPQPYTGRTVSGRSVRFSRLIRAGAHSVPDLAESKSPEDGTDRNPEGHIDQMADCEPVSRALPYAPSHGDPSNGRAGQAPWLSGSFGGYLGGFTRPCSDLRPGSHVLPTSGIPSGHVRALPPRRLRLRGRACAIRALWAGRCCERRPGLGWPEVLVEPLEETASVPAGSRLAAAAVSALGTVRGLAARPSLAASPARLDVLGRDLTDRRNRDHNKIDRRLVRQLAKDPSMRTQTLDQS
jgi:hypothetical protein